MQPRHQDATPAGPAFGEAVAQWRLDLRTEVKKASALPTAMFDACDPMIETQLVDAAESMLACLQQPAPSLSIQTTGELRIELVEAAELRRLPQLLQQGGAPLLRLDDGLQAEYFAVLLDSWAQPESSSRQTAARLLARDFAPGSNGQTEWDAGELWSCTQAVLAGEGDADGRLAELCKRIAAAAILQQDGEPGTPP